LLAAILTVATVCASDDWTHPNSYIGNADWNGGLILWVDLTRVPLSDAEALPFQLRFESKGNATDSFLGRFWTIPVLESRLVFPKAHFLKWITPGGGTRYLTKKSGFRSEDGKIAATFEGDLTAIRSSGWKYVYRNEILVEATSPEGHVIAWKRDAASNVVSVERVNGDVLMKITPSREGFEVVMPRSNEAFVFGKQKGVPGKSEGWQITFPGGREDTVNMEIKEDGVTELRLSSSDGIRSIYRWKTETGDLISDSDFSYEVRETDLGRSLLHRIDASGATEWYDYDGTRGAATYKRQDNSRVVTWYDVRLGPTNMKVFRMDTISRDQKLISSRLLSYDENGEVEKEWTEEGVGGNAHEDGIRFIDLEEAKSLHSRESMLFVDTRSAEAFAAGAIPGAVHLSRMAFERDYPAQETKLRNVQTLIVYCTSRNCEDSSIVATKLTALGFKNVLIFEGGWAEWWKNR